MDGFGKFVGLKSKNPALKALIAVGGWSAGSAIFSQMASTSTNRQAFINSAVDLVKKHQFDGLDMDWEYPANQGGVPADKVFGLFKVSHLNAMDYSDNSRKTFYYKNLFIFRQTL